MVQLAHCAVDRLVQLINVSLAVHLRMEGDVAAAGAVVMDNEIVDGENLRVRQHDLPHLFRELRARPLAEELPERFLSALVPGFEQQHRHDDTGVSVKIQPRKFIDEQAHERERRGDRVVERVRAGHLHGR